MTQRPEQTMFRLLAVFTFSAVCLLPIAGQARVALVIGNSAYPGSPLANPGNDARDVSEALIESGFDVELLLNQGREAMQKAIQRYGEKLKATKQAGVFYFAGHALQMDWRNFLLPTDIRIQRVEDVAPQAVDLNDVLQQLNDAQNGTNIVILDACRDNPFGQAVSSAKGLSQMDAPTGTLLAYATAPGRIAQDAGVGANGLYTEQLLKEMRVPGAKIEDVLKRVRLSVRLQSKGQQVPWESTSLEQDFFFREPTGSVRLNSQAADKAFEAELMAWGKARGSDDVAVMADFIRKWPSGKFSELAQHRLDTLLAAQIASAAKVIPAVRPTLAPPLPPPAGSGNAGSASSLADTLAQALAYSKTMEVSEDVPIARAGEIRRGWRVGDLLVYEETPLSGLFKFSSSVRQRAFLVSNASVKMRNGAVLDPFGYPAVYNGYVTSSDAQMLIAEYQVGKKWSTRFKRGNARGSEAWIDADARVTAKETLTVPAGQFATYRVEIRGTWTGSADYTFDETWWVDTVSLKPIAYEKRERDKAGAVRDHRKGVLTAFENDGRPDQD